MAGEKKEAKLLLQYAERWSLDELIAVRLHEIGFDEQKFAALAAAELQSVPDPRKCAVRNALRDIEIGHLDPNEIRLWLEIPE